MAKLVLMRYFWVKLVFLSDIDHLQVFRHKTKRKFGSAMLTLPKPLYDSVQAYLLSYPVSGNFLFPGLKRSAPMSASTVAKQVQDAWACGGNKSTFTTTKWRKSVVTAVSHITFFHDLSLV